MMCARTGLNSVAASIRSYCMTCRNGAAGLTSFACHSSRYVREIQCVHEILCYSEAMFASMDICGAVLTLRAKRL